MKILVLYSEIAGYFMACIKQYAAQYDAEVHIVRWPVNEMAPFKFENSPGITFHERADYDTSALLTLAKDLQPDLLYITGWIDKPYLKVARYMYQQGKPVVAAFDNQWQGGLKQRIATWISPFYFKNRFTHAWVPGLFQYEYARRLGFSPARILTGMYAADTALFEAEYEAAIPAKSEKYPHTLLYVGRFVDFKGVEELCAAFRAVTARQQHGWKLMLLGVGPLAETLPVADNIEVRGFVQPDQLAKLAHEAGAFVLPSRKEPWGVVLHEFAAAGLPLIASDVTGAATAFVRHGYNGYLHKAENQASIEEALQQMFANSDDQLREMGRRSHELGRQINPQTWASTLHKIAGGDW